MTIWPPPAFRASDLSLRLRFTHTYIPFSSVTGFSLAFYETEDGQAPPLDDVWNVNCGRRRRTREVPTRRTRDRRDTGRVLSFSHGGSDHSGIK